MIEFLYKARGEVTGGKPRVYFTSHPADVKYLEELSKAILKTHDCVILYKGDMTQSVPEDERATALEQMNTFLVPVTLRLLSEPNVAMKEDIEYAKAIGIPILPIMMEPGLDSIYALERNFGERQYLDPYGHDTTAVSFEDKLKKFLDSVLISDEMAKKIRSAFDAYIFLSYRKKDRAYANELMHLIHDRPELYDIAIWYDEFLTPGESFRANIDRMIADSRLFALLVTPSLLESDNFVMREEYPAALRAEKDILPAEMVPTDRAALSADYLNLPECMDPREGEAFYARLAEAITRVAKAENDDSPEHLFLIGLAYLDGIDVEIDRERAIRLITRAAERGLPEAMEALVAAYTDGNGVKIDYDRATHWAERFVEARHDQWGEEHPLTQAAEEQLILAYNNQADDVRALAVTERLYDVRLRILGAEHPDTVEIRGSRAMYRLNMGHRETALDELKEVYRLQCKLLGETHLTTLMTLFDLGTAHIHAWEGVCANHTDLRRGIYYQRRALAGLEKCLGEEDPSVLQRRSSMIIHYAYSGEGYWDYAAMERAYMQIYHAFVRILGEEHPYTVHALRQLANGYGDIGEFEVDNPYAHPYHPEKRKYYLQKAYENSCRVLGEEHPDTLDIAVILARYAMDEGKHEEAARELARVYVAMYRLYKEPHPRLSSIWNNLDTVCNMMLEDRSILWQADEEILTILTESKGEKHPDTLRQMLSVANDCSWIDPGRASELYMRYYERMWEAGLESDWMLRTATENMYDLYQRVGKIEDALLLMEEDHRRWIARYGERSEQTIDSLSSKVWFCNRFGCMEQKAAYCKQWVDRLLDVRGEEHTDTLSAQLELASTLYTLGQGAEAEKQMAGVYEIQCRVLGEDHEDTVSTKEVLEYIRDHPD